jgi:putative hemolysin
VSFVVNLRQLLLPALRESKRPRPCYTSARNKNSSGNFSKGETMRTFCLLQAALILFAGAITVQTAAQTTASKTAGTVGDSYCQQTGGAFETRQAVFGTNNPRQTWLWLGGKEGFCQYTATDGSRIHISIETLTLKRPSLAALAYYAQVPWNGKGNGNPASFYCSQLGGSEIGATDFAGGGWVSKFGIDEVLETCIFPDNSTIDSWGLLYHSVNIIRGIDLSTVLKYPNPFPKKE